ncbi:nucleotide sugar dehydrogenase [bacterium]|nr:nucleotide sugar dehydrogenase [bacterium]
MIIGFAGMSHLGLNSCVAAAEKGFKIIGYDNNTKTINELSSGNTFVDEPGLKEKLKKNKENIKFSTNVNELKKCEIVYISNDIPTDNFGKSNIDPILELIEKVNAIIKKNSLLIVLCQVNPGFTRKIVRNSKCLYYQVETLIFGRAIERALFPERIILGCADEKHYIDKRLQTFLNSFNCPVLPMNYESAEIAKTAINLMLAAQVSVANTLSEICEKTNGDWYEIFPALKLDKRIGQHAYLLPGMGLSGGNIERDIKTLTDISNQSNANPKFLKSISSFSKYRKNWAYEEFIKYSKKINVKSIGIIGLAYKLDTDSTKNSPSISLIKKLYKYDIKIYDSIIKKYKFEKNCTFVDKIDNALLDVDVLFVMLPYEKLKHLSWTKLAGVMRNKVVIDPFRTLPNPKSNDWYHVVLGKN